MAVPGAYPHPAVSMTVDELTRYEFEKLSDDGSLALFRGRSRDGQPSILVRCPSNNSFTRTERERLSREYSLANELDEAWAARPRWLGEWAGKPALVISDPGGSPLPSIRRQSLDLEHFLRMAIAIARCIRLLHSKGLIHRDLRPENLLFDEKWRVWLTGFGVATTLPRERVAPILAEGASGSLKYMAPEQTGRMNRSVDHRADLYSLGVILYELLSGRLPFRATEPIEWIHSHIARAPLPLDCREFDVPTPVVDIVLKLLSKNVEDRYQTAAGVEADLLRCASAWKTSGAIPAFPLATADHSERLILPERLYGREEQVKELLRSFERVVVDGPMEIVLVSGVSGIGKSSVVAELYRATATSGTLFASGKFDQYKRDVPYAALAQPFRALVDQISALDDREVSRWREPLRDALGVNGQLIVDLVPELEGLIGPQPTVASVPATDALRRFDATFTSFIKVFATSAHALALFLDDLQWLDQATLNFLERLIEAGGLPHLLLVGAYRDNEIDKDHPLVSLLAAIRGSGIGLSELALGALSIESVQHFLAETLSCNATDVRPLAVEIHVRTSGNPFHLVQAVTALAEDGSLHFDREAGVWAWSLDDIRARSPTSTVIDLVGYRLTRLPAKTQNVLASLAFLGASTDVGTLGVASGVESAELDICLHDVMRDGLVVRVDGGYAFVHDRVQEAAYALIPAEERSAHHVMLAQRLLGAYGDQPDGKRVFEIVGQFAHGADLISGEDRERVAVLNVAAAKRARGSSAYRSACSYLVAAAELLRPDRWATQHVLAFEVELARAECEFIIGDMVVAETRLVGLANHAGDLSELASVISLQVELYTALDQSPRAIETCLAFLKATGLLWPAHPDPAYAAEEYRVMIGLLKGSSPELLLDLPSLADENVRATLDVLAAALPPAFFSDKHLVALILCRMATLSINHGVSDASALAFAYLGMIIGPYFDDYALAFRFGKLGLELSEVRGLKRYRARILMTFAYHVSPWTRPIREERSLLLAAGDEARARGDINYAGFTTVTRITSMIAAGDPLEEVEQQASAGLAYMRQVKFGFCADILRSQLQLVRALRGRTLDINSFNDPEFDEALFESRLGADRALDLPMCWHWIRKLQARFLAGSFAAALEAAEAAEPLLWTCIGHLEMAEYQFFAALARAAVASSAPGDHRSELIRKLAAHHEQLRAWANNNAGNFGCRADLVAGELARLHGDDVEAIRLYDRAIRAAADAGFCHIEAIAAEVAVAFYVARDLSTLESAYVRRARKAYVRWGAEGKLRDLERRHQGASDGAEALPPVSADAGSLDTIDLADIVRTSNAMSAQVTLEELMTTLLKVVLEHAGASRGLLIMARNERLFIEAEATADEQVITVQLLKGEPGEEIVPARLLTDTMRSSAPIYLDDARAPGTYWQELYFRGNGSNVRSVLCLPILRQAKVVGLLYLENDLATHAFTPNRINVLKLLASQAAISLENASLEEKEALLKEVHHRVKNNLQLITSLLNLQAARVTDPTVATLFAESRDRVRSMALVHENLYRLGNFARVPMKPHLESVCAQLFRAYAPATGQISLQLDIDDIQLDLDRAVACGLIVNELASNALKHAFPDGRRGTLWISLEALEANECLLRVRDDGVGMSSSIDPKTVDTLGLQLVNDLADQLRGSIAIRGLNGADIAITFQTIARRKTIP
jgi:predicted ATPase/two-component sensor histidine kinase